LSDSPAQSSSARLKLSLHDGEELHAYLIAECWRLSLRYDGSQGSRFSVWARQTLSLRLVDWQRARWGRTRWTFSDGHVHERERPQPISLDANDPERDRLDAALGRGGVDGDASGFAADMRDLAQRGRRPSGRQEWLGDEAA
jgi:hypothetical protein